MATINASFTGTLPFPAGSVTVTPTGAITATTGQAAFAELDTKKAALAGATFTGALITLASAVGAAGFNVPHGTAPSSPVNGDFWSTTAGFYGRVNGTTVGPFGAGGAPGGSDTQVQFNSGGTLAGSANLTWDGTTLAVTGGISATGLVATEATGTSNAGLRMPHGTAPSSPVDGDIWTTTAGIYVQINGATVGPLSNGAGGVSGSGAANRIASWSGTSALTSSSNFTITTTSGASLYSMISGTSTATTAATTFVNHTATMTGAITQTEKLVNAVLTVTPGATVTSPICHAAYIQATSGTIASSRFATGTLIGAAIAADCTTSNTSANGALNVTGATITATYSGTNASGTNTIDYVYALKIQTYVNANTAGGTVTCTNLYAIYINHSGTATGTPVVTNKYGVYQVGDGLNYFSGKTGIGNTVSTTTFLVLGLSTTAASSLRIPHGTAPSSPVNGDIWTDTSGMYVRINGVTKTFTLT